MACHECKHKHPGTAKFVSAFVAAALVGTVVELLMYFAMHQLTPQVALEQASQVIFRSHGDWRRLYFFFHPSLHAFIFTALLAAGVFDTSRQLFFAALALTAPDMIMTYMSTRVSFAMVVVWRLDYVGLIAAEIYMIKQVLCGRKQLEIAPDTRKEQ